MAPNSGEQHSSGLLYERTERNYRKEYLLANEGLVYFLLALLDTLSHEIVNIRGSLHTFKALDIVIGTSILI